MKRAVQCLWYVSLWLCATAAVGAETPRYSAAQLYNQGNSYAREGKFGLAVLSYERGALLTPRDADLQENLLIVREAAHLAAQPAGFFERHAPAMPGLAIALVASTAIILMCVSLMGSRLLRARILPAALACTGSVLFALAAWAAWPQWLLAHSAVAVAAAAARSAPVSLGDPLFTLAEAETVRLTAVFGDYVLIRSHGGQTGWVAQSLVTPVVPPAR